MSRNKIKDKLLGSLDHDPFALTALHSRHPSQKLTNNASKQSLAHSKVSIHRSSYLLSPERQDHECTPIRVGRSASQGKKKYLKVVSDPHQLKLHALKSASISLPHQQGKKIQKKQPPLTNERKQVQVQEGSQTMRRDCSIRSINSEIITNQYPSFSATTPSVIIRQKIIPVLIQASNEKTNFYQHQNNQRQSSSIVNQLTQVKLQPSSNINIQPGLIQQRNGFGQTLPHPPDILQNTYHPVSSSFAQPLISNPISQQIPINLHTLQKPNRILEDQTRWQGPSAARTINHSPDQTVFFRNNPTTPIRGFNASPISNQTTPMQILDRKSLEKYQQINCNKQIINKLGNPEIPYGIQPSYNYMQNTTQQKVIHLISQQVNTSMYPSFRTIHKREIATPNQNHQILTPTHTENNNKHSTPCKKEKQPFECSRRKPSFFNGEQTPTNTKSLHHITTSPKPIKHREDKSINLGDSFHMETPPKNRKEIKESEEEKEEISSRKSAFFQTKISRENKEVVRQNTFLNDLKIQIELISSQRKQTESRISKRLDQLSERTSSMAKLCTQPSQQKPIAQIPSKSISSFQETLKTAINSQNICKLSTQPTKQITRQKTSMANTKSDKENQNQPSPPTNLRNQILTRIFS